MNIWFIFQKTKYVWDENKKQFCGLQFPVDLSFGEYMEWKGYQEDHEVTYADIKYGRNQYVPFVYNWFKLCALALVIENEMSVAQHKHFAVTVLTLTVNSVELLYFITLSTGS
jgi:hypothetical protein